MNTLEQWGDTQRPPNRMRDTRERVPFVDLALFTAVVAAWLIVVLTWNDPTAQPPHTGFTVPCMEDEVAVPMIDTNPDHRLTWGCENRETFVASGDSVVIYNSKEHTP